MAFRIGQKVVCLRDREDWYRGANSETYPVKGGVYTVREVVDYEQPAIRLEEIVNPPMEYADRYGEVCFVIESCNGFINFRPVATTSIASLEALLVPTRTKETV